MLTALSEDFAEVADSVHVPLDSRLEITLPRGVIVHPISADAPLWPQWIKAATGAAESMIIAPESDGTLAQGVAMLQASGLRMLNGFGDFLRCVSDKWETARNFAVNGVPHPPTWTFDTVPLDDLPPASRWVVKPRDGCGTENVRVFADIQQAIDAAFETSLLIQPWIEGRAVSVAVIVEGNEITALPAVAQDITAEQISYQGGSGPLCEDDQHRATTLAKTAILSLPRTARGYIGLDLLLADAPSQDCVIEVNPRLTTSYVGLRRIVRGNLAKRLLGLDRTPVQCAVGCGQVSWDASGNVWLQ